MRSGGRGNEADGKDIPMAAQSRLLKFEFFFKILFAIAATTTANIFPGCDCGRLLSIYFRQWLTGVDAWPPANHSYHIHHLRIDSHTTFTSIQPSLHLSTSSNATFLAFSSRSGFPSPPFLFSFSFSVQRLSIIYGGIVRSSVIRVYH